MTTKAKKSSAPVCVFCRRSGAGVQFAIFNPRFQPFGTACVDCERDLPPGTPAPDEGWHSCAGKPNQLPGKPCGICGKMKHARQP